MRTLLLLSVLALLVVIALKEPDETLFDATKRVASTAKEVLASEAANQSIVAGYKSEADSLGDRIAPRLSRAQAWFHELDDRIQAEPWPGKPDAPSATIELKEEERPVAATREDNATAVAAAEPVSTPPWEARATTSPPQAPRLESAPMPPTPAIEAEPKRRASPVHDIEVTELPEFLPVRADNDRDQGRERLVDSLHSVEAMYRDAARLVAEVK